ncbi:VOC family protein [Conexibacter sp. DBS9H8]|uniref:VOC family protein n=1 Tax=Conexibacter sp. DBS9H8 TaxID=2937801 RepID=UPI00200EA545|nr:VOC family protein [Conexibacter sp. DBS9H8]
MDITLSATFLPHTDPEASLAFWRDTLGFSVRQDVGSGTMRWITVGAADQSDVSIVLAPAAVDPGVTDAERETITAMMAKGTFAIITLTTPDLDRVFRDLQSAGVEIVQEPTDQFYGVRDCAIRDPAGTLIRINERR